ncbi:MAG: oligosaccharide flippase family protein [bacterium]
MKKSEENKINTHAKSLHRKITVNSFSNIVRYFVFMAITFLMTPFLLKTLGDSIYGLWILLTAIIGHIGVMELGIQTAVIKIVAEYQAVEDHKKVNETVMTTLIIFFVIGLLATSICWLIGAYFLHFFVSNQANIGLAQKLILILGIDFAFILIRYVFSGMLFGLQMYHLKNFIDISAYAISNFVIYIFLSKGHGILALILIKLVFDVLEMSALAAVCKKVYPFSFNPLLATKESFKKLITFAGKTFASATMVRLAYNADPIIISYFLSTTWVAIFSIPQRLLRYISEISWPITTVFLPVFSELDGKKDNNAIRSIYTNYTRYIVILILPILSGVFVYGIPFIRIWIGEKYAYEGRYVLYFLTGSLFFTIINPLIYRLFYGINRLAVVVKVPCVVCLLNIIMSVLFVQRFGISGVAFATLLSFAFQGIFYLFYTSRYFKSGLISFVRESLATPILNSVIYGTAMFALNNLFPANSYSSIILQGLGCLPIYMMMVFFLSINAKERAFVINKIQSYLPILRSKIFFDI